MTRVSTVVVSFNTRDVLVRCVSEATEVPNAEVIVIDNASDDGSVVAVAESFPDVRLARNPENVGFATAVNQGQSIGHGPYYLLPNSDTFEVKDAMVRLLSFLDENPNVGVVAPQLRNLDGSLQPSGRSVSSRCDEMFWNQEL